VSSTQRPSSEQLSGGKLKITIESMISVLRCTTRNIKRWRDDEMIKRWAAAGMLNAERSFRRVKGCNDMGTLIAGLSRHAASVILESEMAKVA
jgi:hypothetical protein